MTTDLFQVDVCLNQEALDSYIEHRKEIKKPLTKRAIDLVIRKMTRYELAVQELAVEKAIIGRWSDLYLDSALEDYKKMKSAETESFINKHTDRSWRDGL